MNIIGIDNGNKQTKTVSHTFVSGITESDRQPVLNVDWLKYGDKYYILSNARNAYERDKTVNENTFILTLFAIAKEIELRNIDTDGLYTNIHLAVGLPPEHLATLSKKFKDYFCKSNIVSFTYKNTAYSIHISNTYVFPQAYSAVAPFLDAIVEFTVVYVVDIGGYTVDVLELNSGKLNYEKCLSLDGGVIKMYNRIIKELKNDDIDITEQEIDKIIAGDTSKIFIDEAHQATALRLVDEFVNDLLSTLKERGYDVYHKYIYFIGGGASLLEKYIAKKIKSNNYKILSNINANAAGYEYLAELMTARQV